MKKHLQLALLALVICLLFVELPSDIVPDKQDKPSDHFLDIRSKGSKVNRKIDEKLKSFLDAYYSEDVLKSEFWLKQSDITIKNNCIQVVIETRRQNNFQFNESLYPHLLTTLKAFGVQPEVYSNSLFQGLCPIDSLSALTALPEITLIRLPYKPIPDNMKSEGVKRTKADVWQNLASYRKSEKPKVCVLDLGFKGYSTLLGYELPENVVVRSFRADGDIEAEEDHGTACAEIVYDMAPDAELYLVNFNTDVEQHKAVEWLIQEDVDIVSYSIGWFNAGAGDGTGPICEDVKKASEAGILWVCSAGNSALRHWEGLGSDNDGDGWVNFRNNDEILDFWVPANTTVSVYLNWNDWGSWNGTDYTGSNQDYDLYLYYWTGTKWEYVDKSIGFQDGFLWPTEEITGWYSKKGAYWGVAIDKFSVSRACILEMFVGKGVDTLEYVVSSGSLGIPSDSPKAISVGASDCFTDAYHNYSSQGPTQNGLVKPDFCAPSGVSGYTYERFYGTSASAPHLAGALALLWSKIPFTYAQVRQLLDTRAIDLGLGGKDNLFGIGRLHLVK